jgi:hypothetical protein
MGSYDNIVKIEEMRRKMDDGDAQAAQKILDTMELKKIKNMVDLSLMAEVYNENERYEEAIQLYLKIYEKTKSRKSLFQLVDISINRNNAEDAQNYLLKYQSVAPKDFYKYVFRYKIDKLKGEPYEQLIDTLVTLKNTEYTEKWAYELAKTYYKAGMEAECIRECSDIILWFGEGMFVEKAKMLRAYYSGETDKARIMEELKRRTSISNSTYEVEDLSEETASNNDNFINDDSNDAIINDTELNEADLDNADLNNTDLDNADLNDIDINDTDLNDTDSNKYDDQGEIENRGFYDESSCDNQAAIYTSPDYIVEEEVTEFEFGLKKDVQDILTEGWEEEQQYEEVDTLEEGYRKDEKDTFKEGYRKDEESVLSKIVKEESPNMEPVLSESELAEQEVEETIYKLLEEEDMDEEDKKLSQIADEFKINPDEIFGNFLHISSVKKQLVKGLEGIIDDHKKTVYMIITGTVGSGKTTLAKDITLFLNKSGKLKSSKIAKIKADKLNSIDVMSKKETLKDCCVVVENASELKRKTIDSLLELSQDLQGDIAIIFEENKKNMNKLFRECPKLMDLFKNRIHLPQYTQEDLVGFAYASLKQQDYHLSPKAESILQNKINQIVKQSEPPRHLEQIYSLILSAMNAADIRMGKQLSKLATSGRLKEVETLSILPEDFSFKL